MKTRTKIVAFTFAMLLVGSIAYAAADKRRQAKTEVDESDLVSEEDTLSAELLAATEDRQELPKTAAAGSNVAAEDRSDVAKEIESVVEH